jgi:chromosome segregation ATPase
MGATMSLADFFKYCRDNRKRIDDIYREIEEIQAQFNGLYAHQLEERNRLIDKYVAEWLSASTNLPLELAQLLEAQERAERQVLQDEISNLSGLVGTRRQQADSLVLEAQQQIAHLREENPILNQQEEELKARRTRMQQELQILDAELNHLPTFPLGWLTHRGQRHKLLEQRARLVDNLQSMTAGIRTVRAKWQDEKKKLQESQSDLQGQWQTASVETSQNQARLDYLSSNLNMLSKRNAARNLLDKLTEIPTNESPWKERLTTLVELNRSKAAYEAGLKSVAEMLGLLKGLGEGMDRFIRSVGTIYEEQRRYNLAGLTLHLSDAVTNFHTAWPDTQTRVKDEKYLGLHPLEFSQRVQELLQQRLNEASIQRMFEDMGEALNQATKAWH